MQTARYPGDRSTALDPSDPVGYHAGRGRILTRERHIISGLPPFLSPVTKLGQAVTKEAFSALATLLLEAARTDTDLAGLHEVDKDCITL